MARRKRPPRSYLAAEYRLAADQLRALARRVGVYEIIRDLLNLGVEYDLKADTLKAQLALSAPAPEPEPKPDPAFTGSRKRKPARRKRQTQPKAKRSGDAPIRPRPGGHPDPENR